MSVAVPKASRARPAGERPLALRPCSSPSQLSAKASLPMPLAVGSTTVSVAAAQTAASAAVPPSTSTCSPACAASGWPVATTFAARTGMRCDR